MERCSLEGMYMLWLQLAVAESAQLSTECNMLL